MPFEFKFYGRIDYYKELLNKISLAGRGDNLRIASMELNVNIPIISQIFNELALAARRGANIKIAIDSYAFLKDENKKLNRYFLLGHLPKQPPDVFKAKFRALQKVEAAGGRYEIVNPPLGYVSNPLAGRNHIKLAIINNGVYLGGCNLESANKVDLMIGFEHQKTAKRLAEIFDKIMNTKSVRLALNEKDISFDVDSDNQILIDAGIKNRSLIYQTALKLIDNAEKSIHFYCQYFPYGTIVKHLVKAYNRGVRVNIIYNHPLKHGLPMSFVHHGVIFKERLGAPSSFFANQLPKYAPYIHAKIIASEKAAIIGSHNLVPAGVKLGTAELALINNSTNFSKKVVVFMNRQLKLYTT